MTKEKKHEPKKSVKRKYPDGGWADGVSSYSPRTLGSQEFETSLGSETSQQKGNNLQMEVQRENDRKKISKDI